MNQEIDNKLLIKVINGDKKSEKLFIDLCMQYIWGALARFDQISYEDKQNIVSKIIHQKIFGLDGSWIGIKKYRGDSKFRVFLYRIVTNEALDFLKNKHVKYKSKTSPIDEVYDLFEKSIEANDQLTLEICLSKLKKRERKIIDLASQGFKQREISEMLDENSNTIAAILSRAYIKLNKCICS